MQSIICLFFPTFISISIIKRRNKQNNKEILFKYPIYNIFINLIAFLITSFYLKNNTVLFSEIFNNLSFCIKYLCLTIFISLFLPYIIEFLKKNINFKLEIKKGKTKNEK